MTERKKAERGRSTPNGNEREHAPSRLSEVAGETTWGHTSPSRALPPRFFLRVAAPTTRHGRPGLLASLCFAVYACRGRPARGAGAAPGKRTTLRAICPSSTTSCPPAPAGLVRLANHDAPVSVPSPRKRRRVRALFGGSGAGTGRKATAGDRSRAIGPDPWWAPGALDRTKRPDARRLHAHRMGAPRWGRHARLRRSRRWWWRGVIGTHACLGLSFASGQWSVRRTWSSSMDTFMAYYYYQYLVVLHLFLSSIFLVTAWRFDERSAPRRLERWEFSRGDFSILLWRGLELRRGGRAVRTFDFGMAGRPAGLRLAELHAWLPIGHMHAVEHKIKVRPPTVNSFLVRKNFQDFPSYRIFGRMHEALNIDKNKN